MTCNQRYIYNVDYDDKKEWYAPEFWPYMATVSANFTGFAYKDDDVIVCTFPRSGTHMSWLLVRYLLQGSTETIKDPMEDSHLPPMKPNDNQKGRRVFNTHYPPAKFGDEFIMNGKTKFIHVSRNPKDVLVSEFHLMGNFRKILAVIPETWEEWVPYALTTDIPMFNWFNHMRAWEEFVEKNPRAPVLDLRFEEIVRDPETAIERMATFLNVPLSDKLRYDIVVASKFENMKNAPMTKELEVIMGDDAKNITFYRKGKIGDWVNTFTVAQNELFDSAYQEKMKGSKVKNIYH